MMSYADLSGVEGFAICIMPQCVLNSSNGTDCFFFLACSTSAPSGNRLKLSFASHLSLLVIQSGPFHQRSFLFFVFTTFVIWSAGFSDEGIYLSSKPGHKALMSITRLFT